jgi:hypothetical protein
MEEGSMTWIRGAWMLLVAAAAALALTAGASAAPKTGCPAGEWQELTLQEVADAVWDTLLDNSPWIDKDDFRDSAVAPVDKNGDVSICIKQQWGDALNPNSHYYKLGKELLGSPTVLTIARDNNANGSK